MHTNTRRRTHARTKSNLGAIHFEVAARRNQDTPAWQTHAPAFARTHKQHFSENKTPYPGDLACIIAAAVFAYMCAYARARPHTRDVDADEPLGLDMRSFLVRGVAAPIGKHKGVGMLKHWRGSWFTSERQRE